MIQALPQTEMTVDVPVKRDCTRCDSNQYLLSAQDGMGKYACDTCQMKVGFDLEAEPSEFLLDRGGPWHYTKDQFGSRLMPDELRL